MGGRSRWDYLTRADHNPPNDYCPECAEPSKIHFLGGKTVADVSQYRYGCEHGHTWTVNEKHPVA